MFWDLVILLFEVYLPGQFSFFVRKKIHRITLGPDFK